MPSLALRASHARPSGVGYPTEPRTNGCNLHGVSLREKTSQPVKDYLVLKAVT